MGIEELLPRFSEDGCQVISSKKWLISADSVLQSADTCQHVQEALGQLPEVYRTVLWLRDIEGLDLELTSQLLELNVALVKTRLHRARQALTGLLERHFKGGAS
jgi:RNA polymerase sigma-70 factor, ECF subfamily